jgi:hypothetical protein
MFEITILILFDSDTAARTILNVCDASSNEGFITLYSPKIILR